MNAPSPKPFFRLLYRLSMPGSRVNEDEAGLRGRFAWVIDGATGVADEHLTSGGSDAAWLAGLMNSRLLEQSDHKEADEVLSSLEASVAGAFASATAHLPEIHDHHAPSACLGLIGAAPGEGGRIGLEGRFLGDVIALVPSQDGVVRWTDERARRLLEDVTACGPLAPVA